LTPPFLIQATPGDEAPVQRRIDATPYECEQTRVERQHGALLEDAG
jgi:hypothetical protein